MLFLVYIGGYFIVYINRETTAYTKIVYGSVDTPLVIDAIIIRDEKVYKATETGKLVYLLNDMEKVRSGTDICSIQNSKVVASIETNIKNIEEDILKLQERGDELSLAQKDAKLLNIQVKNTTNDNIYKYTDNNIDGLYELSENIQKKINSRNQMIFEEKRGNPESLNDKKNNETQKLNENQYLISVDTGGILSYLVDGMEEVFTLETMKNITKEHINNKINMKNFVVNREVTKDDNIFKIIKSNEYYIACYIPNILIKDWDISTQTTIYIEKDKEDLPLEVTVSDITKGDVESYVLLKSNKQMLDFLDMRNIRLKTSDSVFTGLKIPTSAIIDKTLFKIPKEYLSSGLVKTVRRKNIDGTIETVNINIWQDSDKYIWVFQDFDSLHIEDVLVSKNDSGVDFKLEKIENVRGLFKINSGIAQFFQIQPEDNFTENNGYTIIDPKKNSKIKVHDIIVTDARDIEEGQMVHKKNKTSY